MTIDIGFAHLELPGFGTVGFIDVPGHERFIRNMVAGAWGIDLGLLLVAVDDGWMPQTEDHFRVLQLLGVERIVVGLPISLNGSAGPAAAAAREFAARVVAATGLPVVMADERFTSVSAERVLVDAGLSGRRRRAAGPMTARGAACPPGAHGRSDPRMVAGRLRRGHAVRGDLQRRALHPAGGTALDLAAARADGARTVFGARGGAGHRVGRHAPARTAASGVPEHPRLVVAALARRGADPAGDRGRRQ